MITSVVVERNNELTELKGTKTIQQLNHILQLIAEASVYDPGETDLDDEQPVTVRGLTLGDIRMARRLVR